MNMEEKLRFDPIDREQVLLLASLTPGRRVRLMLEARELAVGLLRGRLRRRYPELSTSELNLKVLDDIKDERRSHA